METVKIDIKRSPNMIWITWEKHRRTRVLSDEAGARFYEFNYGGPRWWRYFLLIPRTIAVFLTERPKILIVQNPSVVLAMLAVLYKKIVRARLVVDSHSAGIEPLAGRIRLVSTMARYIQREADITIVTNPHFKNLVDKNGGTGFVLPDKIPELTASFQQSQLGGRNNVLLICTFAPDEPYGEVIDAAREVGDEIHIYITGEIQNLPQKALKTVPPNVVFTGYLPEEDYVNLLFSVDAVIDLTNRDNCLVCGAYEAVAARKPLVLSNKKALRDYFSRGTVYVENTVEGIKKGIHEVLANRLKLREEITELRNKREVEWQQMWMELLALICNSDRRPKT